jgi:hypothetical protein
LARRLVTDTICLVHFTSRALEITREADAAFAAAAFTPFCSSHGSHQIKMANGKEINK